MLPAVQELARRPNVTVTGICADSAEAYDQWRRDHGNAGFRVRQMSRDDARREIERFGGSYAGPVPFVAAKSGSTLVYDRSGAPNPASLLLDRLADHM